MISVKTDLEEMTEKLGPAHLWFIDLNSLHYVVY